MRARAAAIVAPVRATSSTSSTGPAGAARGRAGSSSSDGRPSRWAAGRSRGSPPRGRCRRQPPEVVLRARRRPLADPQRSTIGLARSASRAQRPGAAASRSGPTARACRTAAPRSSWTTRPADDEPLDRQVRRRVHALAGHRKASSNCGRSRGGARAHGVLPAPSSGRSMRCRGYRGPARLRSLAGAVGSRSTVYGPGAWLARPRLPYALSRPIVVVDLADAASGLTRRHSAVRHYRVVNTDGRRVPYAPDRSGSDLHEGVRRTVPRSASVTCPSPGPRARCSGSDRHACAGVCLFGAAGSRRGRRDPAAVLRSASSASPRPGRGPSSATGR